MVLPLDVKDREYKKFVEVDGEVAVRTGLTVEDIEIGAVELKDAGSDTRAKVKTDGTDNALVVTQNSVPNPSNLDVALSTRLKPADTLTKVSTVDTITNVVKSNVTDSSGTALRNVIITGTEKALAVSMSQDILLSTKNTHSGILAYNVTWEGTADLTYAATAIQTFFKATERCMIYIDQSSDETTWELTDEWLVYENSADTQIVYTVAPYYRVRVKNVSVSSESCTFMLMTAATPNIAVLPRKLDAKGHLVTCINSIHSEFGKDVDISPMGALETGTSVKLVGAAFIGTTIDPNFWAVGTPVGNGAASQTGGTLTLTTGTPTANGSQAIYSVRVGRYVAGIVNYYRGNIRLPTVTTTTAGFINTRRWGAFDANDGYFFQAVQTSPDTNPILSLVCRKATADTAVTSGDFNGEANNQYILDNNCHTYEIYWTNKNAYFKIDDDVIHTVTGDTTTLVSTPSLKVGLSCTNSGNNTAANTLAVRSSTINRFGPLETMSTSYHIAGASTNILKYGPGMLHKVILNNPASGAITVYDNTAGSGTVIAIINPASSGTPVTMHYHCPFSTGLTVVTAAAASDTTVTYE